MHVYVCDFGFIVNISYWWHLLDFRVRNLMNFWDFLDLLDLLLGGIYCIILREDIVDKLRGRGST